VHTGQWGWRVRVLTSVASVLALVTFARLPSAQALPAPVDPGSAGAGWAPFFRDGPLKDSGWAACDDPIGVSIDDVSKFTPKVAGRVAQALTTAVQLWSRDSPLSFTFTGFVPMEHDSKSGVTSPVDGVERTRHLYLAFVADKDSEALTDRIVGLGLPTSVDPTSRAILLGEVTFERDYVQDSSLNEVTALLAHEMGHALGLGHSTDKRDVMYPIVRAATNLGPGDITGLQSLLKPCVDTTASRDYPLP
jgi:hypothetical protein